jgi:hypothetical protein
MSSSKFAKRLTLEMPFPPSLPASFLNAYAILNPSWLSWPVNIYNVELFGSEAQGHERRGEIKTVMWDVWREHKAQCKGLPFVLDLNANQVAVPGNWNLPALVTAKDFSVRFEKSLTARAADKESRNIVEGILREALKLHFRDNKCRELGDLWKDCNSFCQYPTPQSSDGYIFCRRFDFGAKVLSGGVWVLRLTVGITVLDSWTLADYYARGEVRLLADRLEAKRRNRKTRKNRPATIRVVQQYKRGSSKVQALDFEDYDLVHGHAQLAPEELLALRVEALRCSEFKKAPTAVPIDELRLILDTQITQEDHSETIIDPSDREELTRQLRSFVDGANAYGQTLRLSEEPVDADALGINVVPPPDVRVLDAGGKETIIKAPQFASESALKARARDRGEHTKKYGFLVRHPIDPLLVWPSRYGQPAGARLKEDLERIWEDQGVQEKFRPLQSDDIDEIRQAVEQGKHDALFAVLPERSDSPMWMGDTHERLKKKIDIPSQCIHWDNTLPKQWVGKPRRDLEQADFRLMRRIDQKYHLCLLNLLVKSHWFPFAPAAPFNYNVHVGLDVGGKHNTVAMACLGYGFARPRDFLVFRTEQIPIEVEKREPIPTDELYSGLLGLFEHVRSELLSSGVQPDFETTVFYRDGRLLGDGDEWNERDALKRLHEEFIRREWVMKSSKWTAVEITKDAEGWRVMRSGGAVVNPVAGTCVFPYDDEQTALICPTGAPYLTQGTAQPLMVHMIDVHGSSVREQVIRDLIWQADMCFTKPDTGMRLPWVLHVADAGALQLARSYRISGITA